MDSRADEYWFHFHQQKTSFLLMKIELIPRKCSLRRPCIAALSLTLIALASKP
jgi:hypothetical protein